MSKPVRVFAGALIMAGAIVCAAPVLANGGPFVVKYPGGDPAAKGILARLGPDLKPRRETRLRVIEENLAISFDRDYAGGAESAPLVRVSAEYKIENPTDKEIEVDFGFPILRGVYMNPLSMMPRPDVYATVNGKPVPLAIISNSTIYGIIRQRARETVEKAVKADGKLARLTAAVGQAKENALESTRAALADYLVGSLKWSERDAALMAEYARLDLGKLKAYPFDSSRIGWFGMKQSAKSGDHELMLANLGPLGAIGEQKATQFLAQLASRFDPQAAASYEAIFAAWGGDVRERSVDIETGRTRPREIAIDREQLKKTSPGAYLEGAGYDPTIYARLDYLDENAKISDAEKDACKAILKNLPVVFTFAPMNLLHYQVSFPAGETQTVTVSYSQYAYSDTRKPASYQMAYVVHPASLWKEFGPIRLKVMAPEGVALRASVPCSKGGVRDENIRGRQIRLAAYTAELTEKTGEIFVAVGADGWKKTQPRNF